MKTVFRCPHCAHILNPNVKVILGATIGERRGLVLLSPEPGDFKLIADPELPMREGEMARFHCPVCAASLISEKNDHFCELIMEKGDPKPGILEFSRVFGEHATFIIDGRKVIAHGEDADSFEDVNFFGS